MEKKGRISPTMQDIADSLGISRVTVWKVFENKPGVSPGLRMDVIEKAKEMGYNKKRLPLFFDEVTKREESITVSLVISRPESASFWLDIVHYIAKELAKKNINLLYTHVPSIYQKGYSLPASLYNGVSQGIVVINVYDENMTQLIDEIRKPTIFLDVPGNVSPYDLAGDVVLLEGRETVGEIVKNLVQLGCKTFGFIGDTEYAFTNNERYQGFLLGLQKGGLLLNEEVCLTEPMGIEGIEKRVVAFLENLKTVPDAFVCANDQLAYFVSKYIGSKESGGRFKNCLITGYEGVSEYGEVDGIRATAVVNTALLGRRLAEKLLFRMRYPQGDQEIAYIKPVVQQWSKHKELV